MAHTIFTNQVPAILDVNALEGAPGVTLGTTWYSEHDGVVRAIRFYLGNRNYDGVQIVGGVFDWESRVLLAQETYTVTAADPVGFVTIPLTPELLVSRNKRYTVAFYYPCDTAPDGRGHYTATGNYFTEAGIDNPPLHALKNDGILDRKNGTFNYGSALTFPLSGFNAGCYFADVVFDCVATMPVFDAGTATYKEYIVKYRQGGEWKY